MRGARALTFVLVGLVACSGAARPVVSPSPTDDAGRADRLLLTETDLPGAWNGSPHRASSVAERENRLIARCAGAPDPAAAQTADVFGKDFSQGAQVVGSEAVFVRTAADAVKVAAALKGPRAIACATASVRPILAEQLRLAGLSAAIRSVSVIRRSFAVPGFAGAFRVIATLGAAGNTITVQQDVVLLARGRAQVRATFVDVGIPFPPALELVLVKKLSARLAGG
jgi:hypothetical protein